jgi:hypothetical protein
MWVVVSMLIAPFALRLVNMMTWGQVLGLTVMNVIGIVFVVLPIVVFNYWLRKR